MILKIFHDIEKRRREQNDYAVRLIRIFRAVNYIDWVGAT